MADADSSAPDGAAASPLVVLAAGAATLVSELALIRWVPGQIRVLGYFTNFVLLSAFLGFGVGMLSVRRFPGMRALSWAAPFSLLAVVGLTELGSLLHVLPSAEEFLFLEYHEQGRRIPLYPFLALSFGVLALAFLPIGHFTGRSLQGPRPLLRYGLNIVGSLIGIAGFAALSAGAAPPWAWMLLAAACSAVVLLDAPKALRAAGLAAAAATALAAAHATHGTIWSPYQKIATRPIHVQKGRGVVQEWKLAQFVGAERAALERLPEREGFTVSVNDDSYQTPIGLSDQALRRRPELAALRRQYDLPFLLKRPRAVLVLGAGTGNDVAGALRAGAARVDAVEIDPVILALGRRHPDRPYADPRVHTHLADARSFLTRSDRRWDLIVFGLVDSHVLASGKANVRLDSFVFTRESFALARARLTGDGVLIVSHAVGTRWFADRMRATLAAAFGRPPVTVSKQVWHPLGLVYAAGAGVPRGAPVPEHSRVLEDDWPFLYLERPTIPLQYLAAIGLILIASLLAVRRVAGPRWDGVDPHFFALGAGFLLLEARAVTALALHLGATWQVNAAVFAGVLVMALLATAVAARVRSDRLPLAAYGGLFALLGLCFALPPSQLSGLAFGPRVALSVAVAALPLLASGVVFALGIARTGSLDRALASNLLGAMVGGLVEYASMLLGLQALVPVAAVFYLGALLADLRARTRSPGAAQPLWTARGIGSAS